MCPCVEEGVLVEGRGTVTVCVGRVWGGLEFPLKYEIGPMRGVVKIVEWEYEG